MEYSVFRNLYWHSRNLLKAPVRLRILARERQLFLLTPVCQHAPYLLTRLEYYVPSIWRPRWEVIPHAVMSQLHELTRRYVHDVDIGSSRGPGAITANPRESQELPIRRP